MPNSFGLGWGTNFSRQIERWYHSIQLPDGTVTDGVLSLEELQDRLATMPIPADLSGKRALDIGAWDGWYSFELERRGASVTAVDRVEVENFLVARKLLHSAVDYKQLDVFAIDPQSVGYFDVVLFLGVLHHLKHPLLALERVCQVTRDLAIVESYVVDDELARSEVFPRMEFYESGELGDQPDNWFGPSVACLLALCRTAGFVRVALQSCADGRAVVACYRRWDPPATPLAQPAPVLLEAVHSRNYGINFQSARDEYVMCAFDHPNRDLNRSNVLPEVSGYGVHPIDVREIRPQSWLVTLKLPPGLSPGWNSVRLRLLDSDFSNSLRLAVDLPLITQEIRIDDVSVSAGVIGILVAGLPETADRNNVRVMFDGRRQHVDFLTEQDHRGFRRAHVSSAHRAVPRTSALVVHCGAVQTEPAVISLPVNDVTKNYGVKSEEHPDAGT